MTLLKGIDGEYSMLQEAKREAEFEAARKKKEKESPLFSLQNLYGTSVRLLALPLACVVSRSHTICIRQKRCWKPYFHM